MTSLPISRLINVDVVLSPLAAAAQDLSTLLVLGQSAVIDTTERLRTYATLDAVAADFGTAAPEYLCAALYFSQSPKPDFIKIGRWADEDTSPQLIGGTLSAAQKDIAVWNAVADPAFFSKIDGVPYNSNGATLAAQTNLNGVATILQAALVADVAGSTIVWDANYSRFVVTAGGSVGDGATISFLQAPTALGNINFNTGNPAPAENCVFNGTAVTFVAAGPVGNQVLIGGTLAETLQNLMAFLAAPSDVNIRKFEYSLVGLILYLNAVTPGAGGNALTISSTAATASGATLAGATGTDVSGMMGMTSSFSGAYVADGVDGATAVETVALFDQQFGQTWYALQMPQADDNDHLQVAAYIEGANNKHLYGITSQEAGILSPVSTTDIAYELAQLGYNRTLVQYCSSNPYAVASFLGRAINVDYNGNSTVITMMYKQEPGIVAEQLTATQVDALEAKNANVFVAYNNNTAIIEPGKVAGGNFVDVIAGTDWLAVTIMTSLYNLLYTTPTKIPQTDAGTNLLTTQVQAVCSQGVANGLLAAGVWNSAGFGTLKQGDFLPDGFYIYAPPVALQTQADREARKSVPIQVAAKLAGAIQTVDVTINVNP